VFFGHLFSALIGVSIAILFDALDLYGDYWWFAAGLAVSLAITAMVLTGTVHPPGGATALTCVVSGFFGPEYIIRPVMLGVVLMMGIAYLANTLKARCENDKQ
jgi:CBS-domain-containing membrane protein